MKRTTPIDYGVAACYPKGAGGAITHGERCEKCRIETMQYVASGACIRCAQRVAHKVFDLTFGKGLLDPNDPDLGEVVLELLKIEMPLPWRQPIGRQRVRVMPEPCTRCGGLVGAHAGGKNRRARCFTCTRQFSPMQPREAALFDHRETYQPLNACRYCSTRAKRLTATGACLGCP